MVCSNLKFETGHNFMAIIIIVPIMAVQNMYAFIHVHVVLT